MSTAVPEIHGQTSPSFQEVLNAFRCNFSDRGEIGAACAVYHRGARVVHLWGGYHDPQTRTPWEEFTIAPVFSTSKGMTAVAMAKACSDGLLDLGKPVAYYWPEFAQNGKDRITVRQLLAHEAGLPALDARLSPTILADKVALADILARQIPVWVPGARHGYHVLTLGWYESELIRRTDGRSLEKYFDEEIAALLGIKFFMSLPNQSVERRIARLKDYYLFQMVFHLRDVPFPFALAALNPLSLTFRVLTNPWVWRPSDLLAAAYRGIEIPGGSGFGLVQDIANVYSEFAAGAPRVGISKKIFNLLTAPVHPADFMDEVMHIPTCFSMGFMRPFPGFQFGTESAFGMPGLGGSFGFADPAREIGYAYAPNRLGYHLWNDPRELALRTAVQQCLQELR